MARWRRRGRGRASGGDTRHLFDRLRRLWQSSAAPTPAPQPPATPIDPTQVEMLRLAGVAMLSTGQATNDVEDTLAAIARAYQLDVIVVAFPTVVMLQARNATGDHVTRIAKVSHGPVRLDQAGAVEALVLQAVTGSVAPADAVARLHEITAAPPRFAAWVTVIGHALLSVGFGLTLNPTAAALPAYALLGAGVGGLLLLGGALPTLRTAMPVVAAFLVTVMTVTYLAGVVGDEPLRILAPPLVSLLPGLTLTIATVELTSDQVIAGASRIVYGLAQMMLLVFGVAAGVAIAGDLTPGAPPTQLGGWAPWAGVLCAAAGFVLFSSAPRRSFLFIALTLLVTYGAQLAGTAVLPAALSGFVGAVVAVPVATVLARVPKAPPARVLSLAAFWLLVPGAIGFIGLAEAAGESFMSTANLLTTVLALFSIALGMLVGTGLSRDARALHASLRRQ